MQARPGRTSQIQSNPSLVCALTWLLPLLPLLLLAEPSLALGWLPGRAKDALILGTNELAKHDTQRQTRRMGERARGWDLHWNKARDMKIKLKRLARRLSWTRQQLVAAGPETDIWQGKRPSPTETKTTTATVAAPSPDYGDEDGEKYGSGSTNDVAVSESCLNVGPVFSCFYLPTRLLAVPPSPIAQIRQPVGYCATN